MDDVIQVAGLSAMTAVIGPILLSYLNNRNANAREGRLFARQDEVANRVAEAAQNADEVARVAARTAAKTEVQLGQIHTLVNSDMTSARQAELDQTRRTTAILNRLIGNERVEGRAPAQGDLDEVARNEVRIIALERLLADRMVQFKLSENNKGGGARRMNE